jgi:hypothetical protein
MIEFRVWHRYDGERPEKPNALGPSISDAAESWVEGRWEGMDHPNEAEVLVEGTDGKQHCYTVTAKREVSFSAVPTLPAMAEVERAIHDIGTLPVHADSGVAYVNRQSVIHLLRTLGRE